MKLLESTHPQIYGQLVKGHFEAQISTVNPFGKIPKDQTIEDTINKRSKIPGGIVGKTTNPQAVSQWIETTADRSQLLKTFCKHTGIATDHLGHIKKALPQESKEIKVTLRML